MIKKTTKKKIDTDAYVNKDTGEVLTSEFPGVKSVNTVDQDLVIMNSSEYVIIDSKAVKYIEQNFSAVDLGRILKMADMTYGPYNILYNQTTPHDKDSLMEELEYSRNKFSDFMNRLIKKSVIYYIVGCKEEKPVKYIMLNPFLARKRKTIHTDCVASFENITKKL
jgi:hypothetical protein